MQQLRLTSQRAPFSGSPPKGRRTTRVSITHHAPALDLSLEQTAKDSPVLSPTTGDALSAFNISKHRSKSLSIPSPIQRREEPSRDAFQEAESAADQDTEHNAAAIDAKGEAPEAASLHSSGEQMEGEQPPQEVDDEIVAAKVEEIFLTDHAEKKSPLQDLLHSLEGGRYQRELLVEHVKLGRQVGSELE